MAIQDILLLSLLNGGPSQGGFRQQNPMQPPVQEEDDPRRVLMKLAYDMAGMSGGVRDPFQTVPGTFGKLPNQRPSSIPAPPTENQLRPSGFEDDPDRERMRQLASPKSPQGMLSMIGNNPDGLMNLPPAQARMGELRQLNPEQMAMEEVAQMARIGNQLRGDISSRLGSQNDLTRATHAADIAARGADSAWRQVAVETGDEDGHLAGLTGDIKNPAGQTLNESMAQRESFRRPAAQVDPRYGGHVGYVGVSGHKGRLDPVESIRPAYSNAQGEELRSAVGQSSAGDIESLRRRAQEMGMEVRGVEQRGNGTRVIKVHNPETGRTMDMLIPNRVPELDQSKMSPDQLAGVQSEKQRRFDLMDKREDQIAAARSARSPANMDPSDPQFSKAMSALWKSGKNPALLQTLIGKMPDDENKKIAELMAAGFSRQQAFAAVREEKRHEDTQSHEENLAKIQAEGRDDPRKHQAAQAALDTAVATASALFQDRKINSKEFERRVSAALATYNSAVGLGGDVTNVAPPADVPHTIGDASEDLLNAAEDPSLKVLGIDPAKVDPRTLDNIIEKRLSGSSALDEITIETIRDSVRNRQMVDPDFEIDPVKHPHLHALMQGGDLQDEVKSALSNQEVAVDKAVNNTSNVLSGLMGIRSVPVQPGLAEEFRRRGLLK